jgi:hypothetical protein
MRTWNETVSRGKDNSAAAQQVNTPQTKTNAAGVYVNIENLSIRSVPRGNVIADPAGWAGWAAGACSCKRTRRNSGEMCWQSDAGAGTREVALRFDVFESTV